MNSILISFSIFLVVSSCDGAHDGYTQLEIYLTRNVDNRDVNANLLQIRNFLDFGEEISGSRIIYDNSMMDAMHNMGQLTRMNEREMKCDLNERRHLTKLSDALDIAHKFCYYLTDRLNRLQWIVYQKSLEHAHICIIRYTLRFEEKMVPLVGNNFIEMVNSFTDELVSRKRRVRAGRHYLVWLAKYRPGDLTGFVRPAVKHLVKMTYKHFGYRVSQQMTSEVIFERFLSSPCNRYEMNFGPDLFDLAEFDLEMFNSVYAAYNLYNSEDARLVPYFQAYARYKICQIVVRDPYFVTKTKSHLRGYFRGDSINLGSLDQGSSSHNN